VCYALEVPRDPADAAVEQKSADELRAEFQLAQRRRLLRRDVTPTHNADLPKQGSTRVESPPPK
jgi:hypothetical protein